MLETWTKEAAPRRRASSSIDLVPSTIAENVSTGWDMKNDDAVGQAVWMT